MKNKKMSLEKLEIKSFVTESNKTDMETIKGGIDVTGCVEWCENDTNGSIFCAHTQVSCHLHCEESPFTVKTL